MSLVGVSNSVLILVALQAIAVAQPRIKETGNHNEVRGRSKEGGEARWFGGPIKSDGGGLFLHTYRYEGQETVKADYYGCALVELRTVREIPRSPLKVFIGRHS